MKTAERLARLGTETAFAVAAEASSFGAQGHRVYPFHLGDMNIATPPNIVEAAVRAMRDGKTGYCPSSGIPELREALAEDINASHGTSYGAENVAVQPGGKPVVSKFLLALMNPGDEVLYPTPGYPIYESQIEFHGGRAVPYGFREGRDGFELDIDAIEGRVTSQTRLLILNDLHNPTGSECTEHELRRVAELVLKHDLYVLCDEAYFDIRYEGRSSSLASLPGMAERCVILYTFSKKFAMTGWRLGAAIGPKGIVDVFGKLSVNDESCSNHFAQHGALEGLTGDQSYAKEILRVLQERREAAVKGLRSIKGVRCYRPNATFYLFPNITEAAEDKGLIEYEDLRRAILRETGVSVCTRVHFGRRQDGEEGRYIRLAYSCIDKGDIEEGLGALKRFLEGA